MQARCPGQDMRFWTPEDIYDVPCPRCGAMVEFFKDDPSQPCPSCNVRFRNPRIDLGCAKWCPHADVCIDFEGDGEMER